MRAPHPPCVQRERLMAKKKEEREAVRRACVCSAAQRASARVLACACAATAQVRRGPGQDQEGAKSQSRRGLAVAPLYATQRAVTVRLVAAQCTRLQRTACSTAHLPCGRPATLTGGEARRVSERQRPAAVAGRVGPGTRARVFRARVQVCVRASGCEPARRCVLARACGSGAGTGRQARVGAPAEERHACGGGEAQLPLARGRGSRALRRAGGATRRVAFFAPRTWWGGRGSAAPALVRVCR
jgi:hypothetical protein